MSFRDIPDEFPPHLQKLVDMGETGTDIMHGHMKNLMYDTETRLLEISELQDMPEYKYLSGRMDTLTEIYVLTYNLAFAINERAKQRG
jgi:hypothetical protein